MKLSKNIFLILSGFFLICSLQSCQNTSPTLPAAVFDDDSFNFIVACDLGRNGYYDQKTIATAMGDIAEDIDIEFVVAGGDIHHYMGIESVNDPLWMTNYELIYSHPELQIPWYPILGNHEYQGNTQAIIDYSRSSRRWCMPARYYSHSFSLENGKSVLLVHIDTAPLIDKYRKGTDEYPDAAKQDMQQQLMWIDSVLNASTDMWKIVVGHHPVHAETSKSEIERKNLQERLEPILRKNNIDMYISGHIHNFQHIVVPGNNINYVVNTSASLSRNVAPIDGTIFCSPETGFSLLSIQDEELKLYMLNCKKELLHTVEISK